MKEKQIITHELTEEATEIKRIEELIQKFQESCYNGTADISDGEFVLLWDELKRLSPNHRFFVRQEKSEPMTEKELKKEFSHRELEWKEIMQELQKNETEADQKKIFFLEYKDSDGIFSDRFIKIEKVYKKSEKLYLYAYCFLLCGTKTFRVDRILSMRHLSSMRYNYKGAKIKDIEGFLNSLTQKSKVESSAEDLASLAMEDTE